MKKIIIFIIFPLILIFIQCNDKYAGFGTLEGKITIGPLCPVAKNPADPDCQPTAATFLAFPVNVMSEDGQTLITTLAPKLDGSYSARLEPAWYVIMRGTSPGIGGSNLPAEISISASKSTHLDINIDTGIR